MLNVSTKMRSIEQAISTAQSDQKTPLIDMTVAKKILKKNEEIISLLTLRAGADLGGGGGGVVGHSPSSQGFDSLPTQRVPLCTILRYP